MLYEFDLWLDKSKNLLILFFFPHLSFAQYNNKCFPIQNDDANIYIHIQRSKDISEIFIYRFAVMLT